MELLEKDEEHISSLVKQGKKVEAIAFVKDKTGMSLIEAKDYIDKKNISISEEDEQYLSSLINENKELEAVIFLHKTKDMSLLEAKNYTDRLILKKNIETNKRTTRKWGYVYDEELSTFVPNLARQKKALKIMKSIFWIFLLIFLIQLIFWDRSSDIKMITFRFSISPRRENQGLHPVLPCHRGAGVKPELCQPEENADHQREIYLPHLAAAAGVKRR